MRVHKIKYKKNRHQAEFHADDTSRFLHLSTGFGGGKTYSLCMKAIKLSKLNKDLHGGLVCVDLQEFKKDILPEFEAILQKNNIPYRYHKSEHWFKFPWSKGKLFIISAEKPIRGPNWAYALINEVTLIPLVKYKEVIGRVRVKAAKVPQVCSSGTPEGHANEYYNYMIKNPPKGMRVIYGKTDDNIENLNDIYIENLESAYDSIMLDAYRTGLWVNMVKGRFYYAYNPIKNDVKVTDEELEKFREFLVSLDFNVDPFCATVWVKNKGKLHAIDQIKLEGEQGFTTENMILALKTRGYTPVNTVIYPDPAGRARSTKGLPDVKILENAGYTVRVKSAAPSFRKRQLNVNNLLDKGFIIVDPDRAEGIKEDFQSVEMDTYTQEKKKTNPALTHFSDGLDYLCDIEFPFSGDAKANNGTTQTKIR